MVAQRMRDYELVMVLSPEGDEQAVEAAVQRAADFVTGAGGSVSDQENWGVRRLAYPINRFQEGTYVLTRFELDASDVEELDRILKASEDVLRHLITQPDKTELQARAASGGEE